MAHCRSVRMYGGMMGLICLGWCLSYAQPSDRNSSLLHPSVATVDLPGLHNVIHVSSKLFSGGNPEGDAAFASLALGNKPVNEKRNGNAPPTTLRPLA